MLCEGDRPNAGEIMALFRNLLLDVHISHRRIRTDVSAAVILSSIFNLFKVLLDAVKQNSVKFDRLAVRAGNRRDQILESAAEFSVGFRVARLLSFQDLRR